MIRYKVTSTHVNPAYRPKVVWTNTKEEADAVKAKESPVAVSDIQECEVPDVVYEKIKARLSESEQFCKMDEYDQFDDIYMCYRRMLCAIDDFYDGRYAY